MQRILPKLTKDYILARVSQEQIMEAYLGVQVQTDHLIRSPLRADRHPTCGFKYNHNGRLRFRDFSQDLGQDCFDVVGLVIGESPRHGQGFMAILEDIAKRFRIHEYASDGADGYVPQPLQIEEPKVVVKSFTHIDIVKRPWDKRDARYWQQFGISKYVLDYFWVVPCKEVYIDGNIKYIDNSYKTAYAYYFGKDEYGRNLVKVYFPFHRTIRFRTNNSVVQGMNRITCGRVLVITKSYKDVMALYNFRMFDDRINAIAPSSESVIITPEQYDDLRHRFDFIVSLYDFDTKNSIKKAFEMKEKYGITPLFLTDGWMGTKRYGSKDFSDYIRDNGIPKTIELLRTIEEKYNEGFEKYLKWENNAFRR